MTASQMGASNYPALKTNLLVRHCMWTLKRLVLLLLPATLLADPACKADVRVGNQWENVESNTSEGVIELMLSNPGTTDITAPWELILENTLYENVSQSWNVEDVTVESGIITAQATLFWETLKSGSSYATNLGMVVQYADGSPNDIAPSFVSVGGVECDISVNIGAQQPANASSRPETSGAAPQAAQQSEGRGGGTNTNTPGTGLQGTPQTAPLPFRGPNIAASSPS